MALTFTDVRLAVHDQVCSCGTFLDGVGTSDLCADYDDIKMGDAIIEMLIKRGVLYRLNVNDEGKCRHTLSGCCWICGAVGDHPATEFANFPCPTGLERIEIIEWLDGRGFRE